MKPYILRYSSPAPQSHPRTRPPAILKEDGTYDILTGSRAYKDEESGWEQWSLPLGNGWFGANVFGGLKTERIQITENSLANPYPEGLNNLAEIFIQFDHGNATEYTRQLSLNDAVATTKYKVGDTEFTREYFLSYPDRIAVVNLNASKPAAINAKIFVQVPFLKNFGSTPGDGKGKSATVTASKNAIAIKGRMDYYAIDFEAELVATTKKGTVSAKNGELIIQDADAVTIFFTCGTNYKLESRVFLEKDPGKKLAPYPHPHERVQATIAQALEADADALRKRHLADYHSLFNRASIDLGGEFNPEQTTDSLLKSHQDGQPSRYLEELYFQYGRYLLICSSRRMTLPANLQGIWNVYDCSPWSAGYWHNINIQMNYWPVFTTNLAELFESYLDYFLAFLPAAKDCARDYLKTLYPDRDFQDPGWAIGVGAWPYTISSPRPRSHSGPGTGGLTAILFWELYAFTNDIDILRKIYPILCGMASFLNNCLEEHEGKFLIYPSSSPEQYHDGKAYATRGCAFDQQMTAEIFQCTLNAAKLLEIEPDDFLREINRRLPLLDPVLIGKSGQIKEFREEENYGDIGEWGHRHISHLVGLSPGSLINETNPEWMEAAKVSLTNRGDKSTGWAMAHRLNAWARLQDGQHAYAVLTTLLAKGTLPNLWDTHPPFQIDGNFGGTSGIAEMLIQSHANAIRIIPAIPNEWKDGSFKGLRARGGFIVDATWKNGSVTSLTIKATSTATVKIAGPGIKENTVFNASPGETFTFIA